MVNGTKGLLSYLFVPITKLRVKALPFPLSQNATMSSHLMSPSPNFDDRGGASIDLLLLHYTGMQTAQEALARLSDPAARVSAHYFIDLDGTVSQLVHEDKRAWHAGAAFWAGTRNINARSIGIELVNPGHEWGYTDFPEAQIDAVLALGLEIVGRHGITRTNVLAHSDVAPTRKEDPGERFPWAQLAAHGLGWFDTAPASAAPGANLHNELVQIGYDMTSADDAVIAFQRHYCPHLIGTVDEGRPSAETLGTALALKAEVCTS